MIKEAKDLLEAVLQAHPATGLALTRIVRNGADEKKAVMERAHPFAALISMPGTFDNKTSRRAARALPGGGMEKYYIRGTRTVPFQVRIWTSAETEADAIIDAFLPHVPHRWRVGADEGLIEIRQTDFTDYLSAMSSQFLAGVVVAFSLDIATPNERPS